MGKTVGQRIREQREKLNMSQDELAKKVGYKHRSSIDKIEKARVLPSRKIGLMAEALDVTPAFLMGWSDNNGLSPSSSYASSCNLNEITKDKELSLALNKYFQLTAEQKRHIIDTINLLYGGDEHGDL